MGKPINIVITRGRPMFIELAMAMQDTLIDAGFDATVAEHTSERGDFNIFISGRRVDGLSKDSINIHYETDHIKAPYHQKHIVDYSIYTRSLHFFDYKENLEDKNIYFCPMGYSKQFDTNISRRIKWPYFTLGATREDLPRHRFREKFGIHSPIPTNSVRRLWGDRRDSFIVRSKVNINTRAYDDYWFTPLHAAIIMYKGKMLLQDDTGKDDYYFFKPYLTLFTEDNFMDQLNYWIDKDNERKAWEHFIHEEMKAKYRFEDYFYPAIKDLLESYK